MKAPKFLRTFVFVALLSGAVTTMVSCSEDDDNGGITEFGTVTGTVTDEYDGAPIDGVTVTATITDETGRATPIGTSVTTGSDGKYTLPNVPVRIVSVSFAKTGWETRSVALTAAKFTNSAATVNIGLRNASLKITGTVLDGKNHGAPLAGVEVSVGSTGSDVTGADGRYTIENLATDDYVITFTKAAYPVIIRDIPASAFVGGVATLNITMGGEELLRGKTADDLLMADKWYYNEYRGGRNADNYPHFDWSTNYMGSNEYIGDFEEQNEGSTLRPRNDAADQANPANLDVFDTYTYGSKLITEDNKIMTVRVRTHQGTPEDPAVWGVQVIDLNAPTPVAVKIGGNRTHGSGDYADYYFDLSDYVNKEVIIAVGIYRARTGDYWKQLVLRSFRFASQNSVGYNWLPGESVLPDWQLPLEAVRSTMVHTKKSFTGISPVSGDRNNYIAAYQSWRTVSHIGKEWTFMPLFKDPEPFAGEGFVMKTRSDAPVNLQVPEAYFYAKFAIAAGQNNLTLKTRNSTSSCCPDGRYTYFKLTAITESGAVTHLQPVSNTADEAYAAGEGCWRFKHTRGGVSDPNTYASFVYDLSQFNGSNVVLCLGVFQGVINTSENKVFIYSIDLQ
ncbi:MAG: carboxypeptidase-like regulatory domain-containing protein [Prevotellaceae bacterium]|nr:carboxypeptidase-like regulatory domain-containing protein [Prevotellaceae bacterium]